MTMNTDLVNLKPGKQAVVASIQGGFGAIRRLDAMGIRPGIRLRKISAQPFGGPVTVEINGGQVALGDGLARKILVNVAHVEDPQ